MKRAPFHPLSALAALALATIPVAARAATKTYNGPNNGNFATTGNWTPSAPGSTDDAVLGTILPSGVTGNLTVTVNSDVTVKSVTLDSAALPSYMVVNQTAGELSASILTIGIMVSDNVFNQSGGSTCNLNTLNMGTLGTNNFYTIQGATSTFLAVKANIGISGTANFTQTNGNVTVDAVDSQASITLGVNASGFGTYTLSNGSLFVDDLYVAGNGTGVFNQNGGSLHCYFLEVDSTSSTATFNYTGGTITADKGFQIATNGTFNLKSGGVLTTVPSVHSGGTFNDSGGDFGTGGGLDMEGGLFQLQGNNATLSQFSGGGGVVQNGVNLPGVLTLNLTSPGTYSGVIQNGGNGTLSLVLSGGTLTLGGNANTYSGPTTINAGTFTASINNAFSFNSNVTLAGGTLDTGTFFEVVPSLSVTSGTVNIPSGGNLTLDGTGVSTPFAGTLTGAGSLNKAGAGTLTFSGGGTFTGTINVQGTLLVGVVNGIPSNATVSLAAASSNIFVVNANQTLGALSAGNLSLTSFTGNSTLTIGSNNADTSHDANFSGAGSLIKNGSGNFTLGYGASDSSPNTDANLSITVNAGKLILNKAPGTTAVAGPLTFNGGTLILNASDQIADTAPLTLNSGTFTLNNFNETIGNLSGAGGAIALGSGALTVTQTVAASSPATLTGTGNFIKAGAANLTLTATSGYSGALTANAGRLILQGPVSASAFTANSGGTLQFNANTLNIPGQQILANSGGTVEYLAATVSNAFLRGTGTHVILFTNTGSSTFNGVTTFNSTTITQNGAAFFNNFTNGGTLNNNAALTFNGGTNAGTGILNVFNMLATQDFSSSGVINIATGATLTNSVSNLFLLGGSRTYIGSSANHGGTLTLQNATTLEVNGALLVNDGTISGTTNVNYGGTAQGIGAYGPVNVSFGGTFQPGFASFALPGNAATITQLSGNGTIDNTSTGNMTLTLAGNSVSAFSGPIQNSTGNTALNITGTSSLTLATTPLPAGGNSVNSYSGGTIVAPGASFIIAATGALPSAQPITNNGNFTLNANSTAGQLSGLGTTTLGNNTTLTLSQNTGASKQGQLIFNTNAQLNLTTNPLVIEAPDALTKAAYMSQLATEVATGRHGGLWNGPGITSSFVQSNPTQLSIAIADNALLNRTSIGGQSLDSNSILVIPAYFGDANLDGTVNLLDLTTILNNFGTTSGAWTSGNFDSAPTIDLTDLADVLNNFGLSLPNASAQDSGLTSQGSPSPTPEPTTATLLLPLTLLLKNRRRPA